MTSSGAAPRPEQARQLVLDLARAPSFEADQFLEAPCNAAALSLIRRWPLWPDHVQIIVGPAGSGKSHLASIFAEESSASFVVPGRTAALEPALGNKPLVLEDADRIDIDQEIFFHLLNHVRTERNWLLITARDTPETWGLRLPDLVSRLRLAPITTIETPDDAMLKAVMVKLFLDRQIAVDSAVVDFAMRRVERTLEAVGRFVDEADRASLSHGKKVGRTLAADLLKHGLEGEEPDQGPM